MKESLNKTLLFFFFFFFFRVSSLSPDGLSLLALKSAADPSSSPSPSPATAPFSDWNENDTTPCSWSGVSCATISGHSDPQVVSVTVAGDNIRAYLPSELGSLASLRRLDLHGNRLYGSIPSSLSKASALHSLLLHGNNLSGNLPPDLCSLPSLQSLDLSGNSLSGPFPDSLSNCRQLQRLSLAQNRFSGEIPDEIWPELGGLVQLDLSSNGFEGSIPAELGKLKSLSGPLNLSFNQLSGEIPSELGELPVTVGLDLRHNNLTGEIPASGSFATQGPTAFLGNPGLCGFPLQNPCEISSKSAPVIQFPDLNPSTPGKKSMNPALIVLISVADAIGVAFFGLLIVYIYWKRKSNSNSRSCSCTGKGNLGGSRSSICFCWNGFPVNLSEVDAEKSGGGSINGGGAGGGGGGGGEGELVVLDKDFAIELEELLRASTYVLGKSRLGIVYKVVLGSGAPVVVRRLGEGGGQRYREFREEVQAIGQVRHPNIVRLRAYYWASDEKLLISDFISNGNLSNALRGRSGQPSTPLPWSTRLRIAKGTACGLAYLHECSPRKYVHGCIKPSNILLDAEFNPHISDFGLNRLISITGSDPMSSGGFIGSALPYSKPVPTEWVHNYRAPEARITGSRPAQKWDVYSFGVVLLEMLTGKCPDLPSAPSTSFDVSELVRWVRKRFEVENPLSEMVDPGLLQEVHVEKELLAVFHIALACTETDPELRPRMKTVLENLERISA
ncbi:hypothetical protein AAC387_Pa05g0653 [Persea americana]